MGSSPQARRSGRREPAGFTLLAILVVLAALTLVVGMALQRGEDERRSAILVQHDALALSAAEFGLDRTRAYLGAILDKEGDLDKALDPLLDTNCVSLPAFDPDAGTADDHLPVIDGGTRVAYGGADRSFLLLPYHADGHDDGGTPEAAYLVRIEDNDDDADGPAFRTTTDNNIRGALDCREGIAMLARAARSNTVRDRDRSVVVTVVGIAPGTDVTRAQARKVLRARLGSAPAAGLITGGSIELKGASHICGAYGSVSVSNGGFEDGCVCGKNCKGGPADQSCGNGNVCNVQVSGTPCSAEFGGSGATCTSGTAVPPAPKVEVWSRLNAPPPCTMVGTIKTCIPFYYLRADKFTGSATSISDKAQVYMWDYSVSGCENPQDFERIHYPGEPANLTDWPIAKAKTTGGCWKLVYNGVDGSCPGDRVRMVDDDTLTQPSPPIQTACNVTTTPLVWAVGTTVGATKVDGCDDPNTTYPNVLPLLGAERYTRHHRTGGTVSYGAAGTPIPRGVWMVDGNLTFKNSTAGFTVQKPVTIIATGNVFVDNNTVLSLPPSHREVSLMAGRDLELKGGNSKVLTCGDPSSLPAFCPSAAIMVYEQFTMGSNTHLQGQLVVQNAGSCSTLVSGKAVQTAGNSTLSVPALPPIVSPGGAMVLSWGEGSL